MLTQEPKESELPNNGPRVTPALIKLKITEVQFYVFPGTTLTVCLITLQNGFTVTGESACAYPANFNKQIGEQFAQKQAEDKIWMLEGYLLKERLYQMDQE